MQRKCKNINRNRTVFSLSDIGNSNSSKDLVNPDILINQLWMQEEDKNGIKIIELNSSSGSSKESTENFSHAWSYVDNSRFEEIDQYRINEEARRRRRMNHNDFTTAYANQYYYSQDMQSHSNSFYDTYDSEITSAPMNHQRNCFTIINNQSLKSDSSTDNENYEPMEIVEIETADDNHHWDHVYNEDGINYDPNTQPEKRTIWIYSYKNKRLLSDNDLELNIPGQDTSSTSSSSKSDAEQKAIDKAKPTTTTRRIGSPICNTYIPRLDLSLVQTLSNVTELSEPMKSYSKESSYEILNLQPRNNWLAHKNNTKQIENSSVVCGMALSPRERRRRSINTNSDVKCKENVKIEATHAEGVKQNDLSSGKSDSLTLQVQVDIHANEKELSGEVIAEAPESKTITKIDDLFPINVSFADADGDTDNDKTELDYSDKPSIQIETKFDKTVITEPIEKLDSNNWINEEKVETETTIYHYDLENVKEADVTVSSSENVLVDSASRRLWLNNLQLMKPPQWAEYLPITCSPPSLHLSLSLSSINSKKPWFKRLGKCITCCK